MDIIRLQENRMHGDPMFPLGVYMVDYLHNGVIFDYHWHHELEFIYVAEGLVTIQVGTDLHNLSAGETIFIPTSQLHAAYPVENRTFKLYALVFNLSLVSSHSYDSIQRKYIDPFKEIHSPISIHIKQKEPWERTVLHLLKSIITTYEKKEATFELSIKAELLFILTELLKNNPSSINETFNPIEREKIDRLKSVLQYIQEHYQQRISVLELSSLIRMSEGHFSRFFKSIIRKTPVEYINIVRINHAGRLLKETDRKLLDIALEVGFENSSYFVRTFKKIKKCTPTEFRKSTYLQQ